MEFPLFTDRITSRGQSHNYRTLSVALDNRERSHCFRPKAWLNRGYHAIDMAQWRDAKVLESVKVMAINALGPGLVRFKEQSNQ